MENLDNQLLDDMPYKGLEPYSESQMIIGVSITNKKP